MNPKANIPKHHRRRPPPVKTPALETGHRGQVYMRFTSCPHFKYNASGV